MQHPHGAHPERIDHGSAAEASGRSLSSRGQTAATTDGWVSSGASARPALPCDASSACR